MKRMIIALIVVLSILFLFYGMSDPSRDIPDPYYRNIGSNATNEGELRQILPLLEGEYVEGYFDCSEMAVFIEWYLEGHGIDTEIVTGKHDQPHNISVGGFEYEKSTGDHAWVASNISREVVLIEPTIARIVPKELEQYYSADEIHDDVYGIVKSSGCVDEYDWWTVIDIDSPVQFPTPVRLPPASEIETDIFDLVNRERENNGLEAMEWNDEIADIARAHSRDPASYEHTDESDESENILSKNGIYYFDIFVKRTLSLPGPVYNYEESLKTCLDAWTCEESEKQISESDLDESGVGVAMDSDGNIYFTQISIRRIHCGYKGAPCCKEEGYYPWCYKPWGCDRGICD